MGSEEKAERQDRKRLLNRVSAKRVKERLEEECRNLEDEISRDENFLKDLEEEKKSLLPYIQRLEEDLRCLGEGAFSLLRDEAH
ncbi:hypothetical protein GAYE_SCF08G3094 [Galdieria yellowstonensis]|uniref:BZIP domain-containing protein n=1 Tax=Galdieria yellowstonensis TaxID=3028027 RepID=A0AAV9ICZ1_9RHOD|nr:hypothetical protein GAYE_SCF08G3094 [Galdieria yellowstonensis]